MVNNKPDIYNASGVYNGGGIYNCRGVYNDAKSNVVHVGQNDYEFVEINGLLWTKRNLYETLDNVELIYPNGIESNVEKNGLFYTAYDMLNFVVQILPQGWRIPKKSDFEKLYLDDNNRTWQYFVGQDLGGNNNFDLNIRLNGWRSSGGGFSQFGVEVGLWTSTQYSPSSMCTIEHGINKLISQAFSNANGSFTDHAQTAEAIRLCKDA